MSGSRLVVRNVVAAIATQLISWVLTFAITLFLPRYVGASGLGKLAFAASFVAMFGVLVPLGTSNVLIREIARDRSRTGELLVAALVMRFCMGVAMASAATILVKELGYPAVTRTLVQLTAIAMIIYALNDAVSNALTGQENMPRQSVAVITERFLSCSVTIALVIFNGPLWSIAAVGILSSSVSLIVNLTAFSHLSHALRFPTKQCLKFMTSAGMPFLGWYIFQTLYGQCDPLVLSALTNDKTVGWYAAATRLAGTAMIIPVSLSAALLPTLSRLYRDSSSEFVRMVRLTLELVVLSAVPIAILLICLPASILALMHYPHDFTGTIPVLRVSGLGVLLFSATIVVATAVMGSDGQAKMVRTSIFACVMGVPGCIVGSYLTTRFWANGAIGAALSDVALESYLIMAYLRMLPARTFDVSTISFIGRSLLASIPMVILTLLANRHNLGIWGVVAGVPIYTFGCWRLNCLDPQCISLVRTILSRRAIQ